jgi:TldD protein
VLSKKLAIEVLNEMLSTGADYAEIFYEDSHACSVSIENGKVSSSSYNITSGAGLRLLKENRSVYGFTSDLTKKGLLDLAKSLNKSFNGERLITKIKTVKHR